MVFVPRGFFPSLYPRLAFSSSFMYAQFDVSINRVARNNTKISSSSSPAQTTKSPAQRTAAAKKSAPRCAARAPPNEESFGQKATAASAAVLLAVSSAQPALALDKAVLQEKGHAFAENSAQVLRTANGASLKGAVLSAVDVALSAKPDKVLKTVDAGLDMLSTCDANALKKAVVTTEKATAQAISAGELIPDDATIDEVVDAAASVATTCNAGALSTFAKTATDAATSIDGGKLMGLTASAAKVGLSSDKAALAAATAAAGDLVLSLR